MKRVTVALDVLARYGEIKTAYAFVHGVSVLPTPPRLKKIARQAEANLRARLTHDSLYTDPRLSSWHDLAVRMGLSEDDMPASLWIANRILSGRDIPKINAIVDSGNITAAQFQCPVGIFDADQITGDIALRLVRDGETMRPMRETDHIPLSRGEVVYADDALVFSRYAKDSEQTKITATTKTLFCVVDGTGDIADEYIISARDSLISLLRDACESDLVVETGIARAHNVS